VAWRIAFGALDLETLVRSSVRAKGDNSRVGLGFHRWLKEACHTCPLYGKHGFKGSKRKSHDYASWKCLNKGQVCSIEFSFELVRAAMAYRLKYTIYTQWVQGKSMAVRGRASDRNSLLSSNKITWLARKQTQRFRGCTNDVEYKLISVPLMIIIIIIAVYMGYVEITPRPVQGVIILQSEMERTKLEVI